MNNYSKNAIKIYDKLYINKSLGETSFEDVHERVAKFIANNEEEYKQFRYMLNEKIFRPNTPCLVNGGINTENPLDKQLMACFLYGLEDSLDSIIDMWSTCSKIYASGAGVGINITNLREKNSPITSGGVASGGLAYMSILDLVAKTVMAGGKNRRAANLGVFDYYYPDVLEILNCKSDKKSFKSFNISMMVDDWFMSNVIQNNNFDYLCISPNKQKPSEQRINGKLLWQNLIKNVWENGDPGLLFYDIANKYNPLPSYGPIKGANACSEILLPEWNACVLGAINLNKCIINNNEFSWEYLKEYIEYGIKFLNNVIDKTSYLHPKFRETMERDKPIGLGIMGLADIFIKLKIPYNSKEGQNMFKRICKTLTKESIKTSINLAKENGSIIIPDKDYIHFAELLTYYGCSDTTLKRFGRYGIRNCTWTTCQPTGTVALSADCSYSFEPLSAVIWQKELAETGELMDFINPEFEIWLNKYKNLSKQEILYKIIKNNGSVQGIKEIPEEIQNIFKTAHDISPIDKIDMQAAGQRYISLGISSTCNLPKHATIEDVDKIFKYAWKKGLKGITIYRDGCKENQPINFGKKDCKEEIKQEIINNKIERPIFRHGGTFEIKTTDGRLFLTLNKDKNENPLEVFLRLGKAGQLENLLLDTIARLISKNLQNGVPYDDISSLLRGIKGDKFWFKLTEQSESIGAESIMDSVGIIMDNYFSPIKGNINDVEKLLINTKDQCPMCNKYSIVRDTGCRSGRCINENCMYTSCE